MYDKWSLGGCPAPSNETGKSKLQEKDFEDCIKIVEIDTVFDNGVLTDVNCVPEVEDSDGEVFDWPDTSEMTDQLFD